MKRTVYFPLIIAMLGWTTFAFAQTSASDIIGEYWINNQSGKIEIFERQGQYFGKIVWREEVIKDSKNPDPSLRNRSVIGIEFIKNFQFDGSKYKGGTVYSIENGKTYSGKLWLEDQGQTLKMRGFIGVALLGKTMTLDRVN